MNINKNKRKRANCPIFKNLKKYGEDEEDPEGVIPQGPRFWFISIDFVPSPAIAKFCREKNLVLQNHKKLIPYLLAIAA